MRAKQQPTRRPRFEIFKGRGKQPYRWRLIAANGEKIAQSEGYLKKGDAVNGMRAVLTAAKEISASKLLLVTDTTIKLPLRKYKGGDENPAGTKPMLVGAAPAPKKPRAKRR